MKTNVLTLFYFIMMAIRVFVLDLCIETVFEIALLISTLKQHWKHLNSEVK